MKHTRQAERAVKQSIFLRCLCIDVTWFSMPSKDSTNELLASDSAFQPNRGGIEMSPDKTQTVMIMMNTLDGVR